MPIIKLKIRRTSQDGFLAILTAKDLQAEIEGFLPPLPPGLESSFNQWQLAYRQIEDVRSLIAPAPGMRLTPKSVKHYSSAEHTLAVEDQLNQWLNSGDKNWQPIRDKLISISQQLPTSNEETRVVIDVKDVDLRRLPWQEWNLFEQHYPQTEVALSAPKDKEAIKARPKSESIRILVVVGRSDGISTADDLKVIQELEKHGAKTVVLMQPNRQELCEALWDDQGYHIFVFTGHSGSREDGQIGWIELNDKDNLSIEDFKNALKEAINKGLQLAIFNSCDGLGLANQLAQLHLSQCIVMREPVPDRVAVEFLKNFFLEFSANNSLFASVYKARKRLEHFQSDYPGAVWLPTICIEPNVEPLTWQGLVISKPSQVKSNTKPWIITGLASLVIGCITYIWYISQPPQGNIYYGGSTSWGEISPSVNIKIKEKAPKFNLVYRKHNTLAPGTGTGIKMLLNDDIFFALASREIKSEENNRAANIPVRLRQVPVARDGIAIVVHPDLNVPGLSIQQLQEIYTGKITNWQQVGGPNQEITLYIRSDSSSGTVDFFKENILNNVKIEGKIEMIDNTTKALNKVGQDKGGIYFASAPEVISQCQVKTIPISSTVGGTFIAPDKPGIPIPGQECDWKSNKLNVDAFKNNQYPNQYPITRRLFVIVKQNGQVEEKAGDFYAKYPLSPEGQELVEKARYIREK